MSRADRFQNKVVIVTGAAQGIGRGVALNVAAEGGSVLAVDRSELVTSAAPSGPSPSSITKKRRSKLKSGVRCSRPCGAAVPSCRP